MELKKQVPLKDWTFYEIGGPAEYFMTPATVEELREACQWAAVRKLDVSIIGGGTNVLISDKGIAGLVICTRHMSQMTCAEREERLEIEALAGTPKAELVKQFLKRRLAPAMFLCGLPGDVGGGIVMNAGVTEPLVPREFVELVDWVDVMNFDDFGVRRFLRRELRWTYRFTDGWQPGIIVGAGLSWPLEPDDTIPQRVKEATKNRLAKQPLELPSCGSTFKNPVGYKAGELIEQAGLKGYQVGGAQVSLKHANFIVNLGGASAMDVWNVIQHVRVEVMKKFNIQLETEVKFLGRWTS